jgi:hypothetical protein
MGEGWQGGQGGKRRSRPRTTAQAAPGSGIGQDRVECGEVTTPSRRAHGISESWCQTPQLGSSPAIQLLNAATFFKNVFPLM